MVRELKFKVGDKVNAITTYEGDDFTAWQNATVIKVDEKFKLFPYTVVCDHYGQDEPGLFRECELEFAK